MDYLDQIRRFIELTAQAVAIRDADIPWETKRDIVFRNVPSLEGAVDETGIWFNWEGPSSTSNNYEERVRGYVAGLEAKAAELATVLEAIAKGPTSDQND